MARPAKRTFSRFGRSHFKEGRAGERRAAWARRRHTASINYKVKLKLNSTPNNASCRVGPLMVMVMAMAMAMLWMPPLLMLIPMLLRQLTATGMSSSGPALSAGFKLPVSQDSCPGLYIAFPCWRLMQLGRRRRSTAPSVFARCHSLCRTFLPLLSRQWKPIIVILSLNCNGAASLALLGSSDPWILGALASRISAYWLGIEI